jgi:hypothetical protein
MELGRCTVAIVVGLLAGCGGAVVRVPSAPIATVTAAPPSTPPLAAAEAMPASPPAPPPTWSAIFAAYFGPDSPGSCGRASRCHAEEMRDATSAYDWLARRGYIDGTRSALVSPNSCLRWFGGNMPPQARPAEDATRDLQAWVAAGALDD